MITASIVLFIICGWLSVIMVAQRPENVAALMAAMSTVFGLMPALVIVLGADFTLYSYRNFFQTNPFLYDSLKLDVPLFLFSLVVFAFCFGSYLALKVANNKEREPSSRRYAVRAASFMMVAGLFLAIWIALMFFEWVRSGLGLSEFFMPAVRDRSLSETPGFLYVIMMSIPVALMIALRWINGNTTKYFVLFLLIAVATCLTTHQRREIVTVIIAASSIFLIRPQAESVSAERDALSRARRIFLMGLAVAVIAIPGFWYARVFLTSLVEGRWINAFEIRGVTEILFGSPATGFGTFVLIWNEVDNWGAQTFEAIARIASIPIPRLLWPGKPEDLDFRLQETYGLLENPSSFWMGEFYYSLGIWAVPFSGFFGFFLARQHSKDIASTSLFVQGRAVVMLALGITLFKNGFSIFLMRFAVVFLLLFLIWILVRQEVPERGSMAGGM